MGKSPLGDAWGTESGLPDNFTHLVAEAWFGPNEESERDPDKVYLNLRGPAYGEDGELIGDEDGYTLRFGTGKNWSVIKKGAGVESDVGASKFNRNSGVGHLITAIGDEGVLTKELKAVLKGRGAPTEAATFGDLAFRYERTVVSTFKAEDTGEDVSWELPLPVEFLGVGEDALGGKKKGAKTKVKAKAVEADIDDESDDDEPKAKPKSNGKLRKKVVEFAATYEADEYDEFKEDVFDSDLFALADELEEDEELKAEVLDEDNIFAEAH